LASSVKPAPTLSPSGIGEHYDDFSWVYRLYWGEHIHHGLFRTGTEAAQPAQETMLRYCAGLVGIASAMNVVDVGCGYGGTARFIAREYGCRVLGLTISQRQLNIANRMAQSLHGPARVRFELADAETYPFPAGEFDVVWNLESSEHFFDKAAYFRKVAAALRRGGRLMLAAWSGSMESGLVCDIARVFLCPQLLTRDEYHDCIRQAGLRVLHSEEIGPQVARTWDLCARQARMATPVLTALPEKFRGFAQGIALMQEGFRSGQLNYTIVVAEQ
jgi:tocopherol O-methyltransferase